MSFLERRERFMERMDNGIALFRNPPEGDTRYHPDNNFYYLTGFEEPNSVCLLAPQHKKHRFILFVQPKDRNAEIWTGRRTGVEGAKEQFEADEAYPIGELDKRLSGYLNNANSIYYRMGKDADFDGKVFSLITKYQSRRQYDEGPYTLIDSGEIIHEMRVRKDKEEIALTRKAVQITAEAHRAAMKAVKPGMYEYELEALVNWIYRIDPQTNMLMSSQGRLLRRKNAKPFLKLAFLCHSFVVRIVI